MKINIIAVGKLSPDYKKLFEDYKKKAEFYSKVNIIELKDMRDQNIDTQRKKETEEILKAIPKGSRAIYCSLKGKQETSVEFSERFHEDNITFIIGGSYGVEESAFPEKINFSKMTFPHQMFRVILMEQIFRGLSILNNSKYHK